MCLLPVVAAFALVPMAAAAQTGTVVGQVVGAQDGRPLSGAQVIIVGTQRGTLAGADGTFSIESVPAGAQQVQVRMIGYRSATQTVTVAAGAEARVEFRLSQTAIDLDGIVVTGTPGGTERRAIGNVVTRIDAVDAMEVAPINTMADLLNARAPGVVMQPGTGMIGSGPRVRIRGAASFSLNDQPLIYIDGVRVNNDVASGLSVQGFGSGVVSRLNDINPNDIESIEVIKGPAAATLYGTEASNGVIQIITKRGIQGAPQFNVRIRQGANWFQDPVGRVGETYWRNPDTGQVESLNIVQQEKDRGTPIFRTGHNQGYHLNVSGGAEMVRYYASVDYENNEGIEPTNFQDKLMGRLNLSLDPNDQWDIDLSFGLTNSNTGLTFEAGAGGIWFSTIFNTPALRDTPNRGFLFTPPEAVWAVQSPRQDVRRATSNVTVTHQPIGWFRQRLSLGMDLTQEQDESVIERIVEPEIARFFSAAAQQGSAFYRSRDIDYRTFDYSGAITLDATPDIRSTTTFGAQYYRTFTEAVAANGTGFPAPGLRTVDALAQTFGGSVYFEEKSLGFFVQQQFGWRDRLFATAAVRADDHSAFGEDFEIIYYPKASLSWVISEEPFWNVGLMDNVRLRTAYGHTGQSPQTFAALRTFQPVTGGDGSPAVTPQFLGNPELAPERGEEIELGFEAGFLQDRLGVDFTWYHQKTTDAILNRGVAPSGGFPGSQVVNLGAIQNSGYELQLRGLAVQRPNVDWELTFNLSSNESEVLDIGDEDRIVIGSQAHVVGYPVAAWFREKVVSADLDANGVAVNVMCDGGPGAGPVPCAQAPRVYQGRASPKYEGSFSTSLTLFQNLRLYALVDFKAGHVGFDNTTRARCQVFRNCLENMFPEDFDPVRIADVQSPGTLVSFILNDASFAKFRELSASYTLPGEWSQRFGASRASITLAGRNLHTWTSWTGIDPESFFVTQLHTRLEQNNTPQLTQFVATMNVSF
jgi:TonB-linked SusC/RagA family outer membrane protein